jgi:signal transduction histidine kinase
MAVQDLTRTIQELRIVPEISDLPEESLLWLAKNVQEVFCSTGDILIQEGVPLNSFIILVDGRLQFRRESEAKDLRIWDIEPGEILGKLPYSRLVSFPGTVRASTKSKVLIGSADVFPEMIRDAPLLTQRLVSMMTDRVRYVLTENQRQEKLAALGKLSAGLAHELNNPASSAKRSASALSDTLEALWKATSSLDRRNLNSEQRSVILQFERQALQHVQAPQMIDSLTQSENEERIQSWLEKKNVPDAWELAPVLAEMSLEISWLESLLQQTDDEVFPDALRRIVWQVSARKLTKEIESGTGRISELVRAIKEYSYMDQAAVQDVDIHQGLENTLVMLTYKLKHRIVVEKHFGATVHSVYANGSELNMVWTNLIDNAADAMKDGGTLTIRTTSDSVSILVEIHDTGAGIPAAIQHKIFEPFFTTKKMGEGTGLGLDTVYRIIQKHHGNIRFESQPGSTRFQVRLPIKAKRQIEPEEAS